MEFNFNINNYFKDEITKVGSRLIPDNFTGDRREVQDCLSKVSYILTILGEKSAKAQGLQKVITSGEKLRNSDHVVYILIDPKGGSRSLGTVVGMLKVGIKHLYVFDASGNSVEVTTKCILDFYVHESKQRMGLGKKLFQHMLKEERVDPVHLAIDKPSSKFLSFLYKHYGLQKIIPQMNNFVIFDGFFTNRSYGEESRGKEKMLAAGVGSLEGRYSSGSSKHNTSSPAELHQFQLVSSINLNNYYGRQAPHKPVSTMGMILQHKSAPSQQPSSSDSSGEEVKTSETETKIEQVKVENEELTPEKDEKETSETAEDAGDAEESQQVEPLPPANDSEALPPATPSEPFKIELKSPSEASNPEPKTPSEAPGEKIRLNSQGYMDLKFYHSSLW